MKSNNTYFNLLASFAYLYPNKQFCDMFFRVHDTGEANVMIDSGAFTLHNAKQRRDWLTLDSYCNFLHKYENSCEKYVMLDVIGNDEQSKKNYEAMVARSLAPMFVLTMADRSWSYINDTMSVNPHCCVAGGVSTKGDWLIKRFQDTVKYTSGKAQIHGLGYVTFPNMFRVPIVSGDSSSWVAQLQRFGCVNVFTKDGLKAQLYKEIWGGKKMIPALKQMLRTIEVTPKQFMEKKNHVGSTSIGSLSSIISYLDYSKFAYERGRRLFLAISAPINLEMLLWVKENYKGVTYNKFVKEFRNNGTD